MMTFSQMIEVLQSIEFADSRSEIKKEIRATLPKLLENLALVYLTDSQTLNHWQGEIYGNISAYNGVKNKNKRYLKAETYYDFLWKESRFVDTPRNYDALLEEKLKENIQLTQEKIDLARLKTDEFLRNLANKLSKGRVEKQDIYDMLEKWKAGVNLV